MIIIPISFKYTGVEYTAIIQKLAAFKSSPIQYHLYGVKPKLNVPSWNYLVSKNREGLEWGPDYDNPDLPGIIAQAIYKGCEDANISIFS